MDKKEMTFEEAACQLEMLISEVENNSLPLEKMIERITEGARLIKFCQQKLNVMNGKVEVLFRDDNNSGEFKEFDSGSDRSKAANKKTSGSSQDDLPF